MRFTRNDVGPVTTPAHVHNSDRHDHPTELRLIEQLVLSGASRFDAAFHALKHVGPDVFTDPIVRVCAGALITGDGSTLRVLERSRHAPRVAAILKAVDRERLPDTESWAVYLVGALAAERYQQLLVAQLQWAVEITLSGAKLPYIKSRVDHAFAVAAGGSPFDPEATWSEVAA